MPQTQTTQRQRKRPHKKDSRSFKLCNEFNFFLCNTVLNLPSFLTLSLPTPSSVLKIVSLRNGTAGRRGRQITWAWRTWQGYNLGVWSWSWLTSMFSGLLQKDLFKRKWSLAKSYFKQNHCQACHTRFAVFFPLPSCCVSSLLTNKTTSKLKFISSILLWNVQKT